MMKCVQNETVQDFIETNEEKLLCNESENNLILGLVNSIKDGKRDSEKPLFFTIYDNDKIVGQAIRTNPEKPLAITKMPENAIKKLIEKIFDGKVVLEGIIGPKECSILFANIWSEKCSVNFTIGMHQGVYELLAVISPDFENGKLILGIDENRNYMEKFCLGFVKDCISEQKNPKQESIKMVDRYIKNKTLYFWENSSGEIVSMAASTRESKNAATISLVYTPDELRGRGYASRVVAALSQKILDQGKKKCNLYTDLTNPTSNSIYQKVGYKMLGESMFFNFKK